MPDPYDLRTRRTARLLLRAVSVDDVDDLYALSSDPRTWTHLPSGRHTERERTARQVDGFLAAWAADGLGYWTARTHAGAFVGVGGCMRIGNGPAAAWNVYYRLSPEQQGHGYATELVDEAIAVARAHRPDLPVVAAILEHNAASRAVAERVGLTLVLRGPDPHLPPPPPLRLVYADRPLGAAVTARLLGPPA